MKVLQYGLFLILALSLSQTLTAQRPGPHRQPFPFPEELREELNLSEEQKAQLKTIHEKYRESMRALREQEFEDPLQQKQAMLDLMKAQKEETDAVLTAEQKALLKAKQKEQRDRLKEQRESIDKEALHQELKAYHDQNVLPVMKQQRAKLEQQISTEDKTTITQLRTTLEFRRQGAERPQRPEQRPEPTEAQKQAHETLRALVEKYDEQITGLLQQIEPQQQQWREAERAIAEKYLPKPPQDAPHARRGRPHPGAMERPMLREMGKGRFLLLDPAAAPESGSVQPALAEMTLYPNPASASNTVRYTVKESGKVRIELRSENGKVLQVLIDDRLDAGDYTFEVNTASLRSGVYYVTLIDRSGVTSEKLIISK